MEIAARPHLGELTVTRTVLVHNLWVLARFPHAKADEAHRQAA